MARIRKTLGQFYPFALDAGTRVAQALLSPFGWVLVGRDADVREVFLRHEAFSVRKYGERMREATGDFPLGRDDGPAYQADSAIAHRVIDAASLDSLRATARRLAEDAVARADGEIDVVRGLLEPVMTGVVEPFFGPRPPSHMALLERFQSSGAYTFNGLTFHPWFPKRSRARGIAAGAEIRDWLDGEIEARRADPASAKADDDVLGRLLEANGSAGAAAAAEVRRLLAGLMSGLLVPTTGLFARAVDRLIELSEDDPHAFANLQSAARSGDDDALAAHLAEAARFSAYPPVLYRVAACDYVLGAGRGKPTRIRKGTFVLIAPYLAAYDRAAVPSPAEFRLDRDRDRYLLFGLGQHHCLGQAIGEMLHVEMARPLLRLENLRRHPTRGRLRHGKPTPESFGTHPVEMVLRFEAAPASR